jgi:hypothetical protein
MQNLCVTEHYFNVVPILKNIQTTNYFFKKAYDSNIRCFISFESITNMIGGKFCAISYCCICLLL